eukprot:CAMPEP_0114552826 /NCGR_PEP_ID=MMETSP0114-20121206/7328_1 /TAXON_ID=31324 /ORGANISM="Goniomonas sp, Strain m" /LENGTH=919 /DNA_ID=CAMNT_0001737721 /DNA_START=48 /DNA_END=2807 /DNA_ORIENTATION=+
MWEEDYDEGEGEFDAIALLEQHDSRISQIEIASQWRDDQYMVMRHAVADISRRMETLARQQQYPSRPPSVRQAGGLRGGLGELKRNHGLRSSQSASRPHSQTDSRNTSPNPDRREETEEGGWHEERRQSHRPVPMAHVDCQTDPHSSDDELSCMHKGRRKRRIAAAQAGEVEDADDFEFEPHPTYLRGGSEPTNPPVTRPMLPPADLVLEFVYSYRTSDRRPNLLYTHDMRLAYYVGKAVIVFDPITREQKIFSGHTEMIEGIAMDPEGTVVATSQTASSTSGSMPMVFVRSVDAVDSSAAMQLTLPKREGASVLCFLDNVRLAAVCNDEEHTVYVFNWQTGLRILEFKASSADVTSSSWVRDALFMDTIIMVCGARLLKFISWKPGQDPWQSSYESPMSNVSVPLWSTIGASGDPPPYSPKSIATSAPQHKPRVLHAQPSNVLCIALAPDGRLVYAGLEDGTIQVWQYGHLLEAQPGAHEGRVTCLACFPHGLVSGGGDGTIKIWQSTDLLQADAHPTVSVLLPPLAVPKDQDDTTAPPDPLDPPHAVSLSARGPSKETLAGWRAAVGTSCGQVYDFSIEDLVTVQSHNAANIEPPDPPLLNSHFGEGDLWGVARHLDQRIVATCGDDRTLRLWDRVRHVMLCCIILPERGKAVAFSENADGHLAVGLKDGQVKIYDCGADGTSLEFVKDLRPCFDDVFDIKYSPDNRFLAAGSHDDCIHIYDCGCDYRHMGRCQGHSSFITAMDWSLDSEFLQTTSGANELYYWAMTPSIKKLSSSKQVRDLEWNTWTCPLGWPVQGIWPEEDEDEDETSKQSVLRTVCRSGAGGSLFAENSLLAMGDELGNVSLYAFPCTHINAPCRVAHGHASMVTNFCFLAPCEDDPSSRMELVSTAAEDQSMLQWRVVPAPTELPAAEPEPSE